MFVKCWLFSRLEIRRQVKRKDFIVVATATGAGFGGL